MTAFGEAADQQDRPSWLPAELFPFESHYADVKGARVHYVDVGSGAPLVLLHGNPTWSFVYREVIKGLRDRFRCIAPITPGSAFRMRRPATATRLPSTLPCSTNLFGSSTSTT